MRKKFVGLRFDSQTASFEFLIVKVNALLNNAPNLGKSYTLVEKNIFFCLIRETFLESPRTKPKGWNIGKDLIRQLSNILRFCEVMTFYFKTSRFF